MYTQEDHVAYAEEVGNESYLRWILGRSVQEEKEADEVRIFNMSPVELEKKFPYG